MNETIFLTDSAGPVRRLVRLLFPRLLFPPKEVTDVRRAARAFFRSLPTLNWFDVLQLADVCTRDTDSIVEMIRVQQIPADRVALLQMQELAFGRLKASRFDDRGGTPDAVETELLALWVFASHRLRELGYVTEDEALSQYHAMHTEVFGLSPEETALAHARTDHLKQLIKPIAEHIADQT